MALRAASGVANEADNCYYQMLSDPLQIKRAKKEPFFLFSFVMSERWYFMMFCGAAAWCQYRLHYRVCTGEDLNINICHRIGKLIRYNNQNSATICFSQHRMIFRSEFRSKLFKTSVVIWFCYWQTIFHQNLSSSIGKKKLMTAEFLKVGKAADVT